MKPVQNFNVRFAQQIAREPTDTTLLSSRTEVAMALCQINSHRKNDGAGAHNIQSDDEAPLHLILAVLNGKMVGTYSVASDKLT